MKKIFPYLILSCLCLCVHSNLFAQGKKVNVATYLRGAQAVTDAPFSYQGQVLASSNTPDMAIDGDKSSRTSRWISEASRKPHYLEVTFDKSYPISQIIIYPDYPLSTHKYGVGYKLQYWGGAEWKDIAVEKADISPTILKFDIKQTETNKIRFYAAKTDGAGYVKLFEIEAYAETNEREDETALTFYDYPAIEYILDDKPLKLSDWKACGGDNMDYAKPDFNDKDWKSVQVGESIVPQLGGEKWVWYRVNFNLPEEFLGRNLLFDLGRVSAYDEVYVNGIKVGSYGPPPPRFIFGCSDIYRKYPIPTENFHAGQNTLAIRVYVGFRGGLSNGNYTLQPLKKDALLSKMSLKNAGSDALLTLLSESTHLNKYAPGSDLLVKPSLLNLFGNPIGGELEISILENGKELESSKLPISIRSNIWVDRLFRLKAPNRLGKYECKLALNSNKHEYWAKTLDFEVVDPNVVVKFVLPLDKRLKAQEETIFPADISTVAVGHYGPRQYTDEKSPVDNFTQVDSRSGLTLSGRIFITDGAPLLFATNIRPLPKGSLGRVHAAGGHEYDGVLDAWAFGKVIAGKDLKLQKIQATATTWAKRTYRYMYNNEIYLDFSLSTISPALTIDTNSPTLSWFDGIGDFGIGLPSKMAYEENGKLRVVDKSAEINGDKMSANYLLVWFNGSEGWDEFDIPMLFVLEKRPVSIKMNNGALLMSFPAAAKRTQVMPLFGVTLQTPSSTSDWANSIPSSTIERCRYWSRVLVNAPDQVSRHSRADYENDELIVKDEFSHLNIRDDWQTEGLKIVPLPPILPLSANAGNIKIAVSEPVEDLNIATLYGPLLAAKNTSTMLFSVKDLLHYIREVRDVVSPAKTSEAEEVRAELNKTMTRCLDERLTTHPWDTAFRINRLEPGLQTLIYTNICLCLPYLNEELRKKVMKELASEIDTFTMLGVVDQSWRNKLSQDLRDKPLIKTLRSPVTGLEFSIPYYADKSMGIDAVYYECLRIYAIWRYAYTFDDYSKIKNQWGQLKLYFNVLRNSNDWDIGLSWDSISGLRLGNGLQESGVMHAGSCAMARMAYKMNDVATGQESAYYAVMSVVAMQAALNATDYLTWRRPWCASHSSRHGIEIDLKTAVRRHVEFNELGGFSQYLIGSGANAVNSPGGYIETPLPEVMRPYQEIWVGFTNDFYDPKRDIASDRRADERISMDAFVYQMTKYPQTIREVFEFRRNLPDTKVSLWNRITDYRAYLDSLSKIEYQKLW